VCLCLVEHEDGEQAAEPNRLVGQVAAVAVALVEDQVDDREHGGQALGEQVVGRDAERDPRRPDLRLRARQPALHRLARHEEGVGDLRGLQAAQGRQGQRHLRVERERGMAAGEDELQALVGDRGLVHLVLHRLGHFEQARLGQQRALAPQPVDRAVARGRRQPRAGVARGAVARPALGGGGEGLLSGLLGEVEIAEEADQGREHAAPLVAEGLLDQGAGSTSGRTSTQPPRRVAGIRAAKPSAASRSSASSR
jgi:hypothetical protein